MPNLFPRAFLGSAFALFALAGLLALAPAPAPALRAQAGQAAGKMPAPSSPQDISGIWLLSGGDIFDLPRDTAPFQPWAKAKFETERDQHGPNVVLGYTDNTDPFIKRCDPLGVPRVLLANHPFKFIVTPNEVIALYERSHDFREIYTDGREHPKDLDPSWWGNSIGRWESDGTFVVDTIGFNDKTWLDYQGLPHSDQLHIIERYKRMGHINLQLQLTIDDPKAYTKPWSVTKNYDLKPWDIGEEICTIEGEQNFNNGIVAPAAAPRAK